METGGNHSSERMKMAGHEEEEEHAGPTSSSSSTKTSIQTRPSLKPNPLFNDRHNWKRKLRENCYKRVREDRRRLLWKVRMMPTSQSLRLNSKFLYPIIHSIKLFVLCFQDMIKFACQNIVSDELKKLKDPPLSDRLKMSTSDSDINDILWEYDGLHDAYKGECEEILLEMQRIFYEDLRAESTEKEPDNIETWQDEEDEYLAHAVYEHMRLNDKQVNLELLRVRLAELHAEHFGRGCGSKPKFCIESRFDLTALYIICSTCSTFEVVI
ncbi:hypothetical protein FEM48_Zijuj04G0193200 [Ziziphus jujuba var. spinosa]|uniref:RPA-interacting protein N-terminal domain-containing protein n=1 Tax=Ziziphus jujuba var. spinosa TaxID=714518 RepID=A0A978VLP9_ZIZJJ|nr:hypothetical protein FEM48_Zijuj04G0193200 [Ziziphus jujuba var. spinosa]